MNILLENINKCHKNRIEDIKKMKGAAKRNAIGSLFCDICGRCINSVCHILNVSWSYCKKCKLEYLNPVPKTQETREKKTGFSST